MISKETIWTGLILGGVFAFFIALGLVITEFYQAKAFCNGIDGRYSFNFKEVQHYCNDGKIYRYSKGWDFDRDFSKIKVILP